MPRNGSGQYTPPSNTWNPATPETPILSDDWNVTLADLATALTGSLASDGQTTASARIPFAQGLSVADGLVSAPAISVIGDSDTGFYFPAANQAALACGGIAIFSANSTGVTFPLGVTFAGTITGPLAITGDVTVTGSITASANLTINGNITLGNAVGDTLTVAATGTFNGPQTFSNTVTVPDASFTNAKLANMATQTIKGRTTAGSGAPEDLSATQATAILNVVVGDSGAGGTKGLVPAPAAGDAAARKVLSADGTWQNTELKAWGHFTGSTVDYGRNIASVTVVGTGIYQVFFTTAMANTSYAVFLGFEDTAPRIFLQVGTRATGSVTILAFDNAGAAVAVTSINIQVLA